MVVLDVVADSSGARGERKERFCSQQDGNPSDSEGASAPRRRKGALRPTEAPVRNGVQGGMPHGAAAAAAGVEEDIPNSESEGCASAPRRQDKGRSDSDALLRAPAVRACLRSKPCGSKEPGGVRGWAPVYKEERLGDVCHRASRRTAATYSPTWWGSTIGVSGLNFSVRDGKRWFPAAKATAVYVLKEIT